MCPLCDKVGFPSFMDPHHINGRIGANILSYVWVHRDCHTWIHNNPREAKQLRLLSTNSETTQNA